MQNTISLTSKDSLYLLEIYTKNPTTGEGGWDIHFAWIGAGSSKEARQKAKRIRNFDEVIDCEEQWKISPLAGVPRSSLHFIDAHAFVR